MCYVKSKDAGTVKFLKSTNQETGIPSINHMTVTKGRLMNTREGICDKTTKA